MAAARGALGRACALGSERNDRRPSWAPRERSSGGKRPESETKRRTKGAGGPPPPPGRDARSSGSRGATSVEGDTPLGRREHRPVLRVGERAQTLPPPDERHVSERRMRKVALERSARSVAEAPVADGIAEVALIGRSNVGKSSLLNLVTYGAGAAAVSAKPGTTVSMNHYSVDGRWRLVDLPGYGYADAEPGEIEAWDAFTKEYFATRENLAGVLLLVDASVPPTANDERYADWLIEHDTPFAIVFTKCDRNKPNGPTVEENKAALRMKLDERWHRLPSMISTSSVTARGREEVLKFISSLIIHRRQRNEERKNARRREKVKAMKEAKYRAKSEAAQTSRRGAPATTPASRDDDEDEDEEDEDWDDARTFTANVTSKGAKTTQDMIRAELEEIRRADRRRDAP